MTKRILIDAVYKEETRVVIHENNIVQEFDHETAAKKKIKYNLYLAKVKRVEPSLQAAFIEYGADKHGFLPFSEIHPDYFQIPVSDRNSPLAPNQQDGDDQSISDDLANIDISSHIKPLTPPDFSQDDSEDEDFIAPIKSTEDADKEIVLEEAAEPWLSGDAYPEVDDEAEDTPDRMHYHNLYRQYKIQEVIKRNQIILVQTIKEERGNKGASFTSFISLAGRYCVLMPNSYRQGGISRKISYPEDRKRLKSIVESLNIPSGASVIVRTAGSGRTKNEIKRDYDYLVRLWNNIRDFTLLSSAPAFIHAESDLIRRTIRDLYDNNVDEVLVQGDESYRTAKDFMKMMIPAHAAKVKQYRSKTPIFCKYHVEEQIAALYSEIAYLNSGGYVVINQTEALIAIDVNSGKSTSERNIEETATKTNLEAAKEIARQLRLRDLSGLIVIDFIDMMELKNRRLVEKSLKEALITDRAKIQVGFISNFGLLEMSRQRLRPSFLEANTITCHHCSGKGFVRASESNAIMILRTIESEIYKGDYESVHVYASAEVVLYILNSKRADLLNIENRYNIKVMFNQDPLASHDSFSIERMKRSKLLPKPDQSLTHDSLPQYDEDYKQNIEDKPQRKIEPQEQLSAQEDDAEHKDADINKTPKRKNYKRPKRIPEHKGHKKLIERSSVSDDIVNQEQTYYASLKEEAAVTHNFDQKPKMKSPRPRYKNKKIIDKIGVKEEQPKSESPSLLKGLWKKILE